MAAARQGQSNAMLNSLITFVVLFIVATVAAIVCYVKLDEAKKIAENETRSRREIANDSEQRQVAAIIGRKDATVSYLGAAVVRYNQLYNAVTGRIPEEAMTLESANERLGLEIADFKSRLDDARYADMALMPMLRDLKAKRDAAVATQESIKSDIERIKADWSRDVEGFSAAEEKIVAEKNMFISQATQVQQSFEAMKNIATESVERTVSQLQQQIEGRTRELEAAKERLAELEADLRASEASRRRLEDQIEQIKPRPDIEVAAYKPDGKIVSVDSQVGIVYLDLGSNDHIYRGLTFAVYDRNAPIPEDGKGKAEIRIFDVRSEVSAARIISSDPRNPIIPDDIIVNLIWDRNTPNTFVVVGEFDLDGDGIIDDFGRDKVVHLIQSWGGIVTDTLDINTDFVVLGSEPQMRAKPTSAEVASDPLAMDKYEQDMEIIEQYREIKQKAAGLSIPVFNTERFKNLIGYNAEAIGDRPF